MRLLPIEPRATKRAVWIAWAFVALLALALAAWLVVTVVRQSDEIRNTQSVNTAQDAALAEANRRLTEAGEQPVPTPETGPAGAVGPQGPPGPQGAPGRTGAAGQRGAAGKSGKTGAAGNPGAVGATGAAGSAGATGAQGQRGEPGGVGPQGPQGPAGVDGKDGADGKDGQSAFPFTFSFTVQGNPAQSTTYTITCTADGCTVAES